MADNRKVCTIIGRGTVTAIAYLLLLHEGFRRDYRISACSSVATGNFRHDFSRIAPLIADGAVLIYQPPIWAEWGDNGEIYRELLKTAPSGGHQITIPYAVFNPLWPYHHNDSKRFAATAAANPLEDRSLLFAYSDRNVAHMVREGVSPKEIVERCAALDIPEMIDLDRLKDANFANQQPMEAETDVKILDFVLETYKAEQVFSCFNHPSNLLLFYIANQVLAKLDYPPLSNDLLDQLSLQVPEIPVHPSIVRHFNLRWVTPGRRYQIDRFRRLTFEEYVYQIATA